MEPEFGLCFPGRLRDELVATGVRVHDLGAVRVRRPWTVFWARRRLREILRQGIDVVVTHGLWPHAVFGAVARYRGSRLVNVVHDYLKGRCWIDRWAACTPPDAVAANSNYTVTSAVKVFPRVRVLRCYLPIALNSVDRDSVRRQLRVELGTPTDTAVILQASRLEEWKGQAVHLAALAELKEVPGWEAWFAGGAQKAGEAEFLAKLRATAEQLGIAERVRFLGQRSDVPRLMAAADVYCQPNTGPEPFGVSLVEALAAELPVIASSTGGAMEIVNDECGILCPPGDASSVSKALRSLITDPARRRLLGKAGPTRAAELCDPRKQMAAFAEILVSPVSL
jgi:glycosyltransferase involved in cell wall biosynthesis